MAFPSGIRYSYSVPNRSITEIVEGYARADSRLGRVWQDAFLRLRLAPALAAFLDHDSAKALPGFCKFELPQELAKLSIPAPDLVQTCVDDLLRNGRQINELLRSEGHHDQGNKRLRVELEMIVETFLCSPTSTCSIQQPFPAVWPYLAREIAKCARSQTEGDADWRVLNTRLLGGYFLSCRLPSATLVSEALDRISQRSPHGIRGTLSRLLSDASDRSLDAEPALCSAPTPRIFAHACHSELLNCVGLEWAAHQEGRGSLRRLVDVKRPVPHAAAHLVSQEDLESVRNDGYAMYESTVLAFLATAGAEQLLRAAAELCHVHHMKPNGTPVPVDKWLDELQLDPATAEPARIVFDGTSGLRNRIVHAGLIDIESKRMETVFARKAGVSLPADDGYAPSNVAASCLNALVQIDLAVERQFNVDARTMANLRKNWVSDDDIRLGATLSFDFASDEGLTLRQELADIALVIAPGFSQLFQLGFVGWIRSDGPLWTRQSQFAAMVLVLEAISRTCAHFCEIPILQRDHGNATCKYLMLDHRGLLTSTTIESLVEVVDTHWRANARQVLRAAMRVRNAFAHGAVEPLSEDFLFAAGQLLLKSIALFLLMAKRKMIRTDSYFRWEKRGGDAIKNWISSEDQVSKQIACVALSGRSWP